MSESTPTPFVKPTRLQRWIAYLILFTPLGDSELVCTVHWWLIKRFHRRKFGR